MKLRFIGLVFPFLLTISALAQTQPIPAETLLQQGLTQAGREKKAVLFTFDATWCGWCHRLEDFLKADGIKPIVDKHLVIVKVDVMEATPEKKAQFENPGWESLIEKYKAKETGLPTFFILNAKGETVASSIRPADKGGNTGYPGEPDEIAHFLTMMKTAGLNEGELETVKAKLEAVAKTLKH